MKPYIRKIPKTLTDCEKLFDEDVLEIKQLVKDIEDLNNLIHKEQKNFILYDESDFIKETFLLNSIKLFILWHNLITL